MHARPLILCAGLLPACAGPATVLHNPDGHRVFVDGVAIGADGRATRELPFRYYGTGRWDAQPVTRDGPSDYELQPGSGAIDVAPPVTPWLFPLDFPLELAHWLVRGRDDVHATVELPSTPAELIVPAEVPPTGLGSLLERADAARARR